MIKNNKLLLLGGLLLGNKLNGCCGLDFTFVRSANTVHFFLNTQCWESIKGSDSESN